MAVAARSRRQIIKGRERPRLAPPTPARTLLKDFQDTADALGIDLFPWQKVAARYITALGPGDRWAFRHVAIVVARQNGKTRLLVPLIVSRLRMGHRIMHTAQDRNLPREVYSEVAEIMGARPGELATKGGRIVMPRFANGQEEIRMKNGGIYSIVAPTRGGARGPSRDLVIIDELREMDTTDFIAASQSTLQASRHPQMLYLSNAGDDTSIVLNQIKASSGEDPTLAYLEWSADPDLSADDLGGWSQANPSIGYLPGMLENLSADYLTHKTRGTLPIFETENLCRWVTTMRERLVDDTAWIKCRDDVGKPSRPAIGVAMDPDGRRASIAMAWMEGSRVALSIVADVSGDPIDTAALGETLKDLERKWVARVGYDAHTDGQLAKFVRKGHGENLTGQKHAGASAEFARLVAAGSLAWQDADAVTDDLTWTVRKPDGPDGSYQAVHAKEDRPITASLAAIRAVWLASQPSFTGRLVVR